MPGLRQGGDDVAPGPPALGEAVHQEGEGAGSGRGLGARQRDMETGAAGGEVAVGPGAGAVDVNRHARSLLVGAPYRRRGRLPETFCAPGCVSSLAGTGRAFGDWNSAPGGVDCPRLYRNVPDGAGCPRLWSQAVLDTTRPRRRAGCAPSPPLSRTSTTPPEAGNVQNGDKGRDEAENKERKPHDSAVQVMVRASGYPLCHRFGHAAGRTGSRSRAGAGGRARCRC